MAHASSSRARPAAMALSTLVSRSSKTMASIGHLLAVAALFAQKVVARGNGDAREPMLEGGILAELGEVFENAHENILSEIVELMIVAGET